MGWVVGGYKPCERGRASKEKWKKIDRFGLAGRIVHFSIFMFQGSKKIPSFFRRSMVESDDVETWVALAYQKTLFFRTAEAAAAAVRQRTESSFARSLF